MIKSASVNLRGGAPSTRTNGKLPATEMGSGGVASRKLTAILMRAERGGTTPSGRVFCSTCRAAAAWALGEEGD